MKLLSLISLCLVSACLLYATRSYSETPTRTCVKQYFTDVSKYGRPHSIAPSDMERIASKIGEAIGLTSQNIVFIECNLNMKVAAYAPPVGDPDISPGRYIVYDRSYIRNITKFEENSIVVVLGHELAHFMLGHFFEFSHLPLKKKEIQADHFAGCAAAIVLRNWAPVEDLLRRLRDRVSYGYPNLDEAIEEAKKGFSICSLRFADKDDWKSRISLTYKASEVKFGKPKRIKLTSNRSGVSTGSLVESKCDTFTYGPPAGAEIDPATINIENQFRRGDSSITVLTRTRQKVSVRFCAKSQIRGLKKITGDSFGNVTYDIIYPGERETVVSERTINDSFFVNWKADIPDDVVKYSGVITDAFGRQTTFESAGEYENYLVKNTPGSVMIWKF